MVKTCCIPGCNSECYAGCGISFFGERKIPSAAMLEEIPPMKEITSRIEKVSESIRNFHQDCASELEPDIFLAEYKTEKLKALAATARTQALLAEMEMVRIAKRLKNQMSRAKLHQPSPIHSDSCKCSTNRPLSHSQKNSHNSQVMKLYLNKNNGKVQKPVKNNAKLFSNTKYNHLLNSDKNRNNNLNSGKKELGERLNIDVRTNKLHIAAKNFPPNQVVADVSNIAVKRPTVTINNPPVTINNAASAINNPPGAITNSATGAKHNPTDAINSSAGAINKPNVAVNNTTGAINNNHVALNPSLVTAASLGIYKPTKSNLVKNRESSENTCKYKEVDLFAPRDTHTVSSGTFNENVSKLFGSQAAKLINAIQINKASGDKTNVSTSKKVLEPHVDNNKNVPQVTAITVDKLGYGKTDFKSGAVTHKSTGSQRPTILLDFDRETTATKENRYHRYGQKRKNADKRHGGKKENVDHKSTKENTAASKKATDVSGNSRPKKPTQSLKCSVGLNRLSDALRMEVFDLKGQKVGACNKVSSTKEPKNCPVDTVVMMETDCANTETTILSRNGYINGNNILVDQSISRMESYDAKKIIIKENVQQKNSILDIFSKDLKFDKLEIIECEPMDVDSDNSFSEAGNQEK